MDETAPFCHLQARDGSRVQWRSGDSQHIEGAARASAGAQSQQGKGTGTKAAKFGVVIPNKRQ
jgi:hypothetical protein